MADIILEISAGIFQERWRRERVHGFGGVSRSRITIMYFNNIFYMLQWCHHRQPRGDPHSVCDNCKRFVGIPLCDRDSTCEQCAHIDASTWKRISDARRKRQTSVDGLLARKMMLSEPAHTVEVSQEPSTSARQEELAVESASDSQCVALDSQSDKAELDVSRDEMNSPQCGAIFSSSEGDPESDSEADFTMTQKIPQVEGTCTTYIPPEEI